MSTLTLTLSPILTMSSTLETRDQLISPIGSRPSTPPRSTNAPKSLIERMTPSRTWPSSSVAQVFSRCSARSCSSSSRREIDQVLLALIGLGDDRLEFLVHVRRGVLDPRQVDLADRQEAADAVDVDLEAPLDDLGGPGLDDHALPEVLPVGLDRRTLEAEELDAFLGVEPIDDDLDARARLGDLTAFELVDRQDPLALAPQVDEDALAADADDLAGAEPRAAFLARASRFADRPAVPDRAARERRRSSSGRSRSGPPRARPPARRPTAA